MASSRKPGPADLYGAVRAFLAPRIQPGARLCLAYSGGLDSTVLLHLLAELREPLGYRLSAVHVHHGLSPRADAWEAHCRRRCADLGVPLDCRRVRVRPTGQGLEAAARQVRQTIYAGQDADFVVLAHHLDDQVETFFLRLLRGAGADGLAAMAEERPMPAGPRLLRPLLAVSRSQLVAHAVAHGLDWVEDESNADTGLTRNYLRHTALPILAARFPAYRQQVARAAEHLGETAELVHALAELDLARLAAPDGLDMAALRELGPARARNLLRHWLARAGGVPGSESLERLLGDVLAARPDAQPVWRFGHIQVRRHRGRLSLLAAVPAEAGDRLWQGEETLDMGGLGYLDFAPVVGQGLAAGRLPLGATWVRTRRGGERFRPDCRRPRRPLKDWLREAAVPPWQRAALPVIEVAGELLWVAGLGMDCAARAAPGEPGWLISWRPPRR